jgi:hypothetical protein
MASSPNCSACGSEVVEPGSIGLLMFGAEKKGYTVTEGVRAVVCLDCGHISLWPKSRFDLSGLRKARDAGRLKER